MDKLSADIAILGGGPAGYVAAIRAAQLHASVILVEKQVLGGVCLNVGCIPTKALLKSSEVFAEYKSLREFGIENMTGTIHLAQAVNRKNRIVKSLDLGVEQLLKKNNVKVLQGTGRVISANRLTVETEQDAIEVNCNNMIICTGASPLVPSFTGTNLPGVMTSTDALSCTEIPQSITIIGAGVIGLEFATMYRALGSKVIILELMDQFLPQEDKEVSDELLKSMKRQGIQIKFSTKVESIEQTDAGLSVHYTENNQEQIIDSEKVLLAMGRKLNIEAFSDISIECDHGAVRVNDRMETSVKGVYAAGDITGGRLLAHLSFMEGKVAAENACGYESHVNYNAVPACIYTNPEIATVGISEANAITKGIQPHIGRFNFRNNGRALTIGKREGFVKVIADEEHHIIGAQMIGENVSEMISEITLAITLKAKAETIADMIHPHPTLSEAVWEACGEIAGRAIHK